MNLKFAFSVWNLENTITIEVRPLINSQAEQFDSGISSSGHHLKGSMFK